MICIFVYIYIYMCVYILDMFIQPYAATKYCVHLCAYNFLSEHVYIYNYAYLFISICIYI